jgi:hypothetical protein
MEKILLNKPVKAIRKNISALGSCGFLFSIRYSNALKETNVRSSVEYINLGIHA